MRAMIAACALFAPLAVSAQTLSNPDSDFVDTTSKKAWHAEVEKTERGYLLGNPDAEAKLIMFVSYACEGCFDFAFRGDPELDYALLAPGIMSVEVRRRINHPVDIPLSLLASCGDPRKFKVNHAMFMRDQERWRERWNSSSGYNRDLWSRGSARGSLVASLDFDDMMARRRGYSRMDINTCLNDRQEAAQLIRNAEADNAQFGLPTDPESYTHPHFVLNGQLLEGVNDWDALYEVLTVEFKPDRDSE